MMIRTGIQDIALVFQQIQQIRLSLVVIINPYLCETIKILSLQFNFGFSLRIVLYAQ